MVIEAKSPDLPEHSQILEYNSKFVKNFPKNYQSILLTESILPHLQSFHPDDQYSIEQDCGIYWRIKDPPELGSEAADWFYVENVPPTLNGKFRRYYDFWQELFAPLIVLQFVSGDGEKERDKTPHQGKFWVYENVIRPAYYGIYEVKKASVEVYQLVAGRYEKMNPNSRRHYLIEPMGVELGIWQGYYLNVDLPWLRWWDSLGNLLPTGNERAEVERQRAEVVEQENVRLREQLRALSVEDL